MQEEFDQELSQKFRAVFGQYEDASADEGWKRLRARYPEKEKSRLLIWYVLPLAASFFLIAGIWHLLSPPKQQLQPFNELHQLPRVASKTSIITLATKIRVATAVAQTRVATAVAQTRVATAVAQTRVATAVAQNLTSQTTAHTQLQSHTLSGTNETYIPGSLNHRPVRLAQRLNSKGSPILPDKVYHGQTGNNDFSSNPETTGQTLTGLQPERLNSRVPALDQSKNQPLTIYANSLSKTEPSQQITWTELPDIGRNFTKKPKQKRNLSFDAFTGTYISYAKGSDHRANLGGGIGGEIPLLGHLSLTTGLALASNNLYITANQPDASLMSTYASSNKSRTLIASSSAFIAPQISSSGYNASLIGLDIPVNLKYMFALRRNKKLYIAAGVSSDLFIREVYTFHYSEGTSSGSQAKGYDLSQDNAAGNPGGKLNIARLLNFSLGLSYPIGKKTSLAVEPFIKYPIRAIGSQQIRLGYGGINLKMGFIAGKR